MSKLDDVYEQRNYLVVLAAHMANQRYNWNAGWDEDTDNDWDRGWRTVVYIDTPKGQLSFHMDPSTRHLAESVLPEYEDGWDGTWFDTHKDRIEQVV